jgi:hypothetical protein
MVAAVKQSGAKLMMLSIVFPARGSAVKEALEVLERDLPEDVVLLAGGVSAGVFLSGTHRALKSPASLAALRESLLRG